MEEAAVAKAGMRRRLETGPALTRNAANGTERGTMATWTGDASNVGSECDAASGAAKAVVVASSSGRERGAVAVRLRVAVRER